MGLWSSLDMIQGWGPCDRGFKSSQPHQNQGFEHTQKQMFLVPLEHLVESSQPHQNQGFEHTQKQIIKDAKNKK